MAPIADHEHNWFNLQDGTRGTEFWTRDPKRIKTSSPFLLFSRLIALCIGDDCTASIVKEEGPGGREAIIDDTILENMEPFPLQAAWQMGRYVPDDVADIWFPLEQPCARTE